MSWTSQVFACLRARPELGRGGDGDGHRARERGASVVEFVMIATLLILLLFATLQAAVFVYARNIVAASAANGARYAAGAGITSPSAGSLRASSLIRTGLSPSAAELIPCVGTAATDALSGVTVATVHCRGRLRLVFLPLRVPLWIDITASSLKESARP